MPSGGGPLIGPIGPTLGGYISAIILNMTETPESRAGQPRYDGGYDRPRRLSQALAWVGIIAGVVFVVAVVFFSGFFLGWSSGGHYGGHHGWHGGYYGGQMGPGGQTGPGGMMGPGQTSPTTTAPSTPRP